MSPKQFRIEHYLPKEITPELLDQMEELVHEISPDLPIDHIKTNHLNREGVEFVLIFEKDHLLSIISCVVRWTKHPLKDKKVFLSIGDLAYRRPHPQLKNSSRIAAQAILKTHLGRFWFLKSFVSIGYTVNPKLFVQFYGFMKDFYPNGNEKVSDKLRDYCNEHISRAEGHDIGLDNHLVSKPDLRYPERSDISEEYDKIYKCRNEAINDFYFEHGVLIRDGDKIYLGNKSVAMIGFYSPWKQLFGKKKKFSMK